MSASRIFAEQLAKSLILHAAGKTIEAGGIQIEIKSNGKVTQADIQRVAGILLKIASDAGGKK
nr:hypothetical protein [uncultured Nitrososphaera sp.]